MTRETKAQRLERYAYDNAAAAAVPEGSTYESDIFGTCTLGAKHATIDTVDHYNVRLADGLYRHWAAATVVAAFTAKVGV